NDPTPSKDAMQLPIALNGQSEKKNVYEPTRRRISAIVALAVVFTGVACSSQNASEGIARSSAGITVAPNELASPSSGFSTTSQAVTTDSKGAPWVVTGFTNINLSLWNSPTLPLNANAWSQTDPLSNKT